VTIHKLQFAEATEAIQNSQTIVIISHVGPDGDALGSLLGMGNALKQMGKDVTLALQDGVPDYLEFLPNADLVVTELPDDTTWDVCLSTDASDAERCGEIGIQAQAKSHIVINLDHHVTNTMFGDIHLVSSEAVSAAEISFSWLEYMQYEFESTASIPLLTGMVTDTLGFRISSVNPRTFEIAQKLMSGGANLYPIIARTLQSMTIGEFRLWQQSLPTAVLEDGIIHAIITQDDVARAGLEEMTDGGLVSKLVQVDEALIAIVFKVISDTQVQITMRAKLGFDVSDVAFSVGGGGHKQAAGATIDGTIDTVKPMLLEKLKEAVIKGELRVE